MKRATKFLIILSCVSLCAGGAIFSVKERVNENHSKTKFQPINNQVKPPRMWIWS